MTFVPRNIRSRDQFLVTGDSSSVKDALVLRFKSARSTTTLTVLANVKFSLRRHRRRVSFEYFRENVIERAILTFALISLPPDSHDYRRRRDHA